MALLSPKNIIILIVVFIFLLGSNVFALDDFQKKIVENRPSKFFIYEFKDNKKGNLIKTVSYNKLESVYVNSQKVYIEWSPFKDENFISDLIVRFDRNTDIDINDPLGDYKKVKNVCGSALAVGKISVGPEYVQCQENIIKQYKIPSSVHYFVSDNLESLVKYSFYMRQYLKRGDYVFQAKMFQLIYKPDDLDKADGKDIIDIKNKNLFNRLKGRLIIKTEDKGMAYFVHPQKMKLYFIGNQMDQAQILKTMKKVGVGVTSKDLNNIPIAIYDGTPYQPDSDGDGLDDFVEAAILANKSAKDTDGDGYDDFTEVVNGYNWLGEGKIQKKQEIINKFKGNIVLQTQQNGEAWYVEPASGNRYFLGPINRSFYVLKEFGVGVSNRDFDKLLNSL